MHDEKSDSEKETTQMESPILELILTLQREN